jgi:hypothetical protein
MKKNLLIILLTVIGFTGRSLGQGTCTNATFLSPTDTIIQLSANDSIVWFVYQANTSYLRLSLLSSELLDAPLSITNNSEINVYSGNCSNLIELFDNDSMTSFIYSNSNLIFPSSYFIKVKYKGEWDASLQIERVLYQNQWQQSSCQYYCNLISNGNFNITSATYAENNPFYLSKVPCWCAAWGSPAILPFYPPPLTNNSVLLGCGYQNINTNSPFYFNGSEAIYQDVNIESNKTYNLSFKYKQWAPFHDDYGGKLHVLITSDNFGCLGNVDNNIIPGFDIIPNINNIVWEYTTIVKRYIDLDHHKLFTQDITMPLLNPNAQYKLLFYLEYIESSPYIRKILLDDVSLEPLQLPTVSIIPTIGGTICPGVNNILTAVTSQSNFGFSYSWSTGYTSNTFNYIVASPQTTTNYTCTVTDINGCTATAFYTVPVHQVPTPVINANFGNSICEGQTVTYTTQSGYTGYQWNISSGGTITAGGTGNNYVTVVWNTPGNQTVSVNFISNMCPTSTTTYNLTVHPNPTVYAGDDREICKGDIISIGGSPTATGAPNISFNWFSIPATAINQTSSSNPTVAPLINTTFHVIATSSNGCNASDEVTVVVKDFQTPIITGHNNNCDLTTTYTATNGSNYSWSKTVNGTVTTLGTATTQTVTWPSIINNSDPCIVKVTNTENGCTSNSSITVYNCCKDELPDSRRVFHDEIINNSIIPPIAPEETVYLNGTIIIDNDNLTLNSNSFRMGPYAKIIVKEPFEFTITAPTGANFASTLEAGCQFMWDGVYVSDPAAKVEVTGNSTIRDAINGIVSDNAGIVTIEDALFKDNYFNVKISNTLQYPPTLPYLPYNGTIKKTHFEGKSNLPYPPLANQKTYDGIHCTNVYNPFIIGDESSSDLRNYFSDMRFGIYANNSDLYIYNNKFTNIVNGTYIPSAIQKYYPEGAIYAVHNDVKPYILSNTLKVGANITEPLKRNYFENCNTGIYSFQYVNTLNNNDFKDCYNGISLVNISSGTEIRENMVYTSSASIVMPGKGISVRNAHQPDDGIDCLIEENHITNKQIGISMLGVKSAVNFTRVTHNYINNYITGFPNQSPVLQTEQQAGISVSNCDNIEVSLNNINRNYPALGANLEQNSILGIWVAECRGANIFQNYMTHMGSGIYTNGLLTNTKFSCNTLDDNYHGFQFGFNSSVSQQGTLGGYNPYNKWLDFNPQAGHERMYDNGLSSQFDYYYDPNADQMYNPLTNNPLIHLTLNPGGEYLCVNNGTVGPLLPVDPIDNLNAREVALGQIVRDQKYYSFLEEEYRAKDREYAYTILREDPSIMNMGGPDDNVYLQFYNDGYNSDIERVLQMREEMYEQNLEIAREKLSQIADDNTINTNRKIVDNIYIDSWANGICDFTQTQENALTAVANLPAYAGGDAVYTARVMLNIDPMDIGVDYAKPPQSKKQIAKENPVKVFPNPATDQLSIQFTDIISNDAIIEIYGNMGNLVLCETMHAGNFIKVIDISKLNAGLYFYNINLNGTKVSSGKLTILNK